jgi:hypothetical protein
MHLSLLIDLSDLVNNPTFVFWLLPLPVAGKSKGEAGIQAEE